MKTDGSDKDEKGNAVARSPLNGLKELLNSDYVKHRFMDVMGEKSPAFLASILNATQKNPELAKCEPMSVVSSAMVAATLDLPIDSNLGFAALVPYNTKRKDANGREYWIPVAQFQIMYKGFIQLALRSGQYKTINVSPIYADEFESYDIITGDIKIHPVEDGFRAEENQEKIVGYVVFFRLINGFERMEYWSVKKLEAHGRRFSKDFGKDSSLWKKDPHAMYAKTVLKSSISKWGILSVSMQQMQNALAADQAVIGSFDKPIDGENLNYVDATADGEVSSTAEQSDADSTAGEAPRDQPEAKTDAPAETKPPEGPPKTDPPAAARKPEGGSKDESLFSKDEEAAMEETTPAPTGAVPGKSAPDFGV